MPDKESIDIIKTVKIYRQDLLEERANLVSEMERIDIDIAKIDEQLKLFTIKG